MPSWKMDVERSCQPLRVENCNPWDVVVIEVARDAAVVVCDVDGNLRACTQDGQEYGPDACVSEVIGRITVTRGGM